MRSTDTSEKGLEALIVESLVSKAETLVTQYPFPKLGIYLTQPPPISGGETMSR